MTIKSNLYVEKVSSEHPIALWMLNDQLDYISLITETERAIETTANWTVAGATPSLSTTDPDNVPFPDSHVTKIVGTVPGSTSNILIESDFYTNPAEFNIDQANVGMSGYLYVDSTYSNSVSFGYKYFNGVSTVEVLSTQDITDADPGSWVFFSDTFNIPSTSSTNVQIVFKINVSPGGSTGADYTFYFNGITFGQWSEEFNKSSLGLDLSDYSPPSGFIPGLDVVPAVPYGISSQNAYYIVDSTNLYAKNFGVPIVYGSSNVTKLYYNSAGPSLVFPGYGFLNQKGKYNDYTAEMWVKINADTSEPHKIFGPVFSNDGLYIEGPFLTFVIGGEYSSHYIGEWYRPMLIHIRYIQNNLSVLLNGEQIINIPFIENNLTLPDEFDGATNQDWLGFYAHPDITPLEIDSFALYSYSVANEVAKRRWVWGQGVIAPEQTGSALNAVTSFNDYTYSDYSVNYNYPDYAKWDQAFFSNVETTSRSLELPSYSLPTFNFTPVNISATYSSGGAPAATTFVISAANSSILVGQKVIGTGFAENTYVTNVSTTTITVSPAITSQVSGTITFVPTSKTIQDWYDNNKAIMSEDVNGYKFFSFRPNSSWNSIESTAYFSEYGFLAEPVESFYGLFYSNGSASNQLLFKVENKITKEYIKAVLNSTTITYSARFSGMASEEVLGTKTITANQRFVAGINVPTLSQKSITGVRKFFSNESVLGMYMFGDNVDNTFSGRVYSFNFDGKYNNRNLSLVNYADGFFDTTLGTANIVLGHTANYTLEAFEKYGEYFLDVSVAGYWQDYMPLTYFGKYVTDYEGVQHYDLDMIQFNIDYPEPIETEAVELTQAWNYDDLNIWFRQDVTRTYESLDSFAYTGWDDYAEMNDQTTQYEFYNTVDNYVRSYVSFQPILTGANQSLIDLSNHVQARTNAIVDTTTLIGEWEVSAYEVVDGSIIFPPTIDENNDPIDFNDYALVYHLDFKAKATLQNKVRVRNLQLASQVLERSSFTEMGTKFAVPVYPFTKLGFSYDFKAKNYTSTYKGSTPHLYLNRHSGWRIRKASDDLTERGISIPINFQETSEFEIKGVQMWLRYSESAFPTVETRLFSLEYNDGIYDFYVISDSSTQRGLVYGKDRITDAIIDGIQYYVNGSLVKTPYLVNQEWLVLGVQFPTNVSFNNDVGRLNLNGPFTYNNVSAYLITNLERAQTIVYRNWGQVADEIWDYWENSFTWEDVFIISSTDAGILNFGDIYQQYVGTNRIIIDDPTRGVLVDPERLRFYEGVSSISLVRTPV
jgi:hypothetical protein